MGFVSAHSADTGGSSASTVVIPTFATTGSNRNIYVGISKRFTNSITVSSIARGSDTYVKAAGRTAQGGVDMELWNSTNEPQTATATLTVTLGSAHGTWTVIALVVDDSDQTTRIGNISLNPDASTASGFDAVSFSSATGRLVADFVAVEALAISAVAGGTQTLRKQETVGATSLDMACSTAPGAASVDMDWTIAAGTDDFVHYVFDILPSATPPVGTVPASGTCINTYGTTAVAGMSVAAGTSSITSVTVSCTAGGLMTFDTTGTSVSLSGNGTNSVVMTLGASATEYSTVLDTLLMQGSTANTTLTITLAPTDGTLSDSDNFDVLCDPAGVTITGTNANVITSVGTLQIRLLAGQTNDTISVNVVDDTAGTPLEADSSFVVGLAEYFNVSTLVMTASQLMRHRRKS